jgi:hypothetical protein
MFKNFINEGISFDGEKFIFNFGNDTDADIIKLVKPTLNTTHVKGFVDVVHYVYSPEQKALQSDVFTKFINFLKFGNFKDDSNKRKFVNTAISKLGEHINLLNIGVILYPQSRSNINIEIVKAMRLASAIKIYDFELVKEIPNNIEFDIDKFSKEELSKLNIDGSKKYNRLDKQNIIKSIKQLIDKTKSMQYFSIANVCKSKYKPYFTNFLKFKSNDERQQFIDIASNDILIVDDVTTTGSTILEICRIIRNAGVDSKIIVFTVIGNSTLY